MDLAVVMPVYNEEDCIVPVLESWRRVLSELGITFRIYVLNDGSRDRTAEVLSKIADDDWLHVINKVNTGHGPTILHGYRLAVDSAQWVFQCDSDDEISAEHFPALWEKRNQYDALFGVRTGRNQPAARRLISASSRRAVRALFGEGVTDVNVPYRLIGAALLRKIIVQIPDDTFAPNLIISGAVAQAGLRIYNHPVPYSSRRTGVVSIVKWKLWRAAFKSLRQTVACRPRLELTAQ